MKKIVLIPFLCLVLFVSCKKSSNDTTAPVITLKGDATVNWPLGSAYVDAGASAQDDVDGDISSSIVTTNNVNVNTVNTYYVYYNVTDKAGNKATQVQRKVEVKIF